MLSSRLGCIFPIDWLLKLVDIKVYVRKAVDVFSFSICLSRNASRFSFADKLFSSVQSLSRIWLFLTLWTAARQASLSITNSWSLLKLMSIESVMPSNHLILCHPLLLRPSILPSIRVFSKESALRIMAKILKFQLQHQSFQYWVLSQLFHTPLVFSTSDKLQSPNDSFC